MFRAASCIRYFECSGFIRPPLDTARKLTPQQLAAGIDTLPEGVAAAGGDLAKFALQQKLVDALKSRGYPVFLVTPAHAKAGDNLFRVQVGPFPTRADAESVRGRLSKEGFKPFIRH